MAGEPTPEDLTTGTHRHLAVSRLLLWTIARDSVTACSYCHRKDAMGFEGIALRISQTLSRPRLGNLNMRTRLIWHLTSYLTFAACGGSSRGGRSGTTTKCATKMLRA
jgi:hypothetical protein